MKSSNLASVLDIPSVSAPIPRLRVGVDLSALDTGFKAHAHRGIGRYVAELSRYFERSKSALVNVGGFDHRMVSKADPISSTLDSLVNFLPLGRNTIKQQFLYPWNLRRNGMAQFDILHFPAHMDAPANSKKRYILTVLDLIPLIFSDLYKAQKGGLRFKFARWLEIRAIKNAAMILAISENTARDVHRILGIPMDRIVVTPLGVDPKFFAANMDDGDDGLAIRARYRLDPARPIVLYVGGIDPRKNIEALLRSFTLALAMAREKGIAAPQLMVAGNIKNDGEFPRFQKLANSLGIESDLIVAGYVPDHDLLKVLALASVFFFPSLYEGFGLPPLEAMAAGVPVVSSNTSSMPEILGDAALMISPENHVGFATAIVEVLSNQEFARGLSHAGRKRAALFSWDKTGEATLSAYERFIS